MSHVDFKKTPCRPVDFKGKEPQYYLNAAHSHACARRVFLSFLHFMKFWSPLKQGGRGLGDPPPPPPSRSAPLKLHLSDSKTKGLASKVSTDVPFRPSLIVNSANHWGGASLHYVIQLGLPSVGVGLTCHVSYASVKKKDACERSTYRQVTMPVYLWVYFKAGPEVEVGRILLLGERLVLFF